MTLIVALRGREGLVLAADSRGTIGDPRGLTAINDNNTKLFELGRYCGIGVSGSSELAAKLVDELHGVLNASGHQHADDILTETRVLVRARYDDWFGKFAVAERPGLALTLCGYHEDAPNGLVPRAYLLSHQTDFAPFLFANGNCLAGVPQYAVYLLHRLYNPDMTVGDLSRLAAYLIAETATQDPKVGGPIRIATITPSDGYRDTPTAEVDEIVRLNGEQNDRLRQFFFSGGSHGITTAGAGTGAASA